MNRQTPIQQMRHSARKTRLWLQLFAICVLCASSILPHLHVVYPATHDAATCPVYLVVLSGAVVIAAIFALMLTFRADGRTLVHAIPISDIYPAAPWHPRAPPV